MSLVAIVNLAERILNQKQELNHESLSSSAVPKGARGRRRNQQAADEFTSSQQDDAQAEATAESAGLFRVRQATLLSASEDFRSSPGAAPQTNQASVAGPSTANAKAASA